MILSGIFDTGMSGDEAVRRAMDWWDTFGRHQLPKDFNTEITVKHRKAVRVPGLGFPAVSLRSRETVIPAGLLEGKLFADLTKDEKLQIVKTWHHFFVRVPQIEAGKRPAVVDQVLRIRCDSFGHPKATRDEETVYRARTQAMCSQQAHEAGWLISSDRDICPDCCARAIVDEPEGVQ